MMLESDESPITISFVIPVLNGANSIDDCLRHIESEMHENDEIIVVDNGSTDATIEIVGRHPRARVLRHPQITIAGLRNRGAGAAGGHVFAFIDADCLVKPGWRAGVVEVLSTESVAATGSTCDLPTDPTWVEKGWAPAIVRSAREVGYINSANLVIRREAFFAVSGFNEMLKTDEDYDIAFRMRQNGATIIESPRVRAIHLGSAKTLAQFFRRQRRNATSIVDTWRSNGLDRPMIMTLAFIASGILGLIGLIAAAITGQLLYALGLLLILIAPLFTAVHRVLRGTRALYIPPMTVLFVIFYWVRTVTIFENLIHWNRSNR